MKSPLHTLPLHLLSLVSLSLLALAQPASLPFKDCFTGNVSQKLQVYTVYAQVLNDIHLNLTVIGVTPVQIVPASNNTQGPVATTLFATTGMLTFSVWSNDSYFCNTLRPQSPLPALDSSVTNYCPLGPGPFAFSSTITLPAIHDLATFNTRLRAVDPFQNDLLCIAFSTTPLRPSDSVYGYADAIFWITVVIAICYWLVVGLARIVSAWGRGLGRSTPGLWHRLESAGFIIASALSGEKLATSPALLRFCTPSLRDIIFHTQWCAALGMVALRWPQFVYPLLSQTAWSMLSYNITITQKRGDGPTQWNPLSVPTYNPPSNFADQLSNAQSPLFIDQNVPNTLFMLPQNVTTGIPAFAAAVGLHHADLFSVTLILFLSICAAAIVFSATVWGVDRIATVFSHSSVGAKFPSTPQDMLDKGTPIHLAEENRSPNSHFMSRSPKFGASRWRWRTGFSTFHGSVLQGNLVRVLVLFHFPVTIFSCYQMTIGRRNASLVSIILSALSFCFISVIIPIILLFRLYMTNTSKLYDETWTLLALGPLYNHYRHGSQLFACLLFATNVAFGITIGCGQENGTVQAICILVIEVVSALGTSFWLPWGQGASMGLISFLFCVARIIIAVLMVILTPVVSIADDAAQWVAYAILIILALVYFGFILMLMVKLVEACVRIYSGVGFLRSRHVVDSGLFGACGLAGCCGIRKRTRSHRKTNTSHQTSEMPTSSQMSLNRSSMMKPPHLPGTPTGSNSTPPSVLRPEHALQPYREESDDEEGFIMGAWHSSPRPGYAALDNHSRQDSPKASGFTRVGGGRSHYDTPYAIQMGSNFTFPSGDRPSVNTTLSHRLSDSPPTPTVTNAVRNLPAGAMAPAHIRTKSQTAIIEDSTLFLDIGSSSKRKPEPVHRHLSDDDLSLDLVQPKKKPWFQILRNRRNSEGNLISTVQEEAAAPAPSKTEGRSFVVVRKGHRGDDADSDAARASGSHSGDGPRQATKSFVVLRGSSMDMNNGTSRTVS